MKFLRDFLNKCYGINVYNVVEQKEKSNNTIFLVTDKDNNLYLLKRYNNSKEKDLQYELSIINHLSEHEFRTPKVINTTLGDEYVIWSNYIWVLFEFIEESSVEYSYSDYLLMYEKYFNIMQCFISTSRVGWDPLYDCRWIKTKNNIIKYPELFEMLYEYEDFLLKHYPFLLKTVIHGDLKLSNIIKGQQGLYLIDYENARVEARILDIAHLADSITNVHEISRIEFFKVIRSIKLEIPLNESEIRCLLPILLIHKITEVIYYDQRKTSKIERIIKDIMAIQRFLKESIFLCYNF